MIKKIISGGQTGVDQAALLIASEQSIEIGGWCPLGGLDENTICVLSKYPSLKETATVNPDERTKLNIRDSDGTLIVVPSWPLPENIQDGTRLTIDYAQQQNKPYVIISLNKKESAADKLSTWIKKFKIRTLNVAGPRESSSPGINHEACSLFRELFAALQ